MKEKFNVTGMTCSACSSRVEKVVSKLDGTEKVSVNLLTNSMQVEFNENVLNIDDIIAAVEKSGYGASIAAKSLQARQAGLGMPAGQADVASGVVQPQVPAINQSTSGTTSQDAEIKSMKIRLIWSLIFWVPLMIVAMGPMMIGREITRPLSMILLQIALLIPIVFLNRKYFQKGFPSLLHGSPNMDSLIAVGSAAAIIYGVYAVFQIAKGYETGVHELVHTFAHDVYFESAATILTLITVGKYLEARSKGKTSQAIEKLMNLAPKTAMVVRDGVEMEIPAEYLLIGDILLVKPGESIAADGVIEDGRTSVDESAITGESIPVEKQKGDTVVSASINKSGFIKVRCTKVGEDSTINQIIRLVEDASSSKAPIARLADQIAGVFVPVVMGIALVATIAWLICGATFEFALSVGIAVLVISCPCALGLATPVAIMVGTGKGAENGILIKSGEALETAHSIDTVVMDKTGTITEGKPVVTDIYAMDITAHELVRIAASIEKGSEHPLAEAIVSHWNQNQLAESGDTAETLLQIDDFEAVFGKGIKAKAGSSLYLAGNLALMEECGVSVRQNLIDQLAQQGKTPLIFAKDGAEIGIIAVSDKEKASSKQAIKAFAEMGIDVVMLTGDNEKTAEAVRQRLDIPKAIAQVLPQDKEKHITALQAEGHKVAMIGDGINDAPALAKADLGIAIGAGTDVAIESADAVLMRNDLLDAVTAIRLSKAVIKNIKENLFWAFFYNTIGIPVAAGVLYPLFAIKLSPMIGAAAMSLSSVCVVSNALRLRRFKVERIAAAAGKEGSDSEETKSSENAVEKAGEKDENFVNNKTEINIKETQKETKEEKEMKYELKIEGMMCMHCQKHMSDALNKMEGVTAEVNLEEGKAYVTSEKEITMDEFKAVVEDAGYTLVQ